MPRFIALFTHLRFRTLLCALVLSLTPFAIFFDVTFGGATLLPADNLYQFQPYRQIAAQQNLRIENNRVLPHNDLLNDLVLQNYQWKSFARATLRSGELPLWNPYLFGGVPFLAAGQHSMLYPFSVIYLALPLHAAFGWFQVSQLVLAGLNMFALIRTYRLRRSSALFAGVAFQLCGVMIVSAVHPMIVASTAWIPLMLAMAERVIQSAPGLRGRASSAPWALLGAAATGMHVLAGHVEITVYAALILATYSLWRLFTGIDLRNPRQFAGKIAWLCVMAGGGFALAAIQLLPLFELVTRNFRGSGRSTLEQVRSYAFPSRYVLMWLFPNLFGSSASDQQFINLFTGTLQTASTREGTWWGYAAKEYVESAVYAGLAPLVFAGLAVYARMRALLKRAVNTDAVPALFFIALATASVLFMFGTAAYALLYYGLPGINQLHSPYRWKIPFTLCLIVLAALGLDRVQDAALQRIQRATGMFAVLLGGASIGAVLLARIAWSSMLQSRFEQAFQNSALAVERFPDAAVFFSYTGGQVILFGLLALTCGAGLLLLQRNRQAGLVVLLAMLTLDLSLAWRGFNPAVDAKLLQTTPPALAFLQAQLPADLIAPWRVTSYEPDGGTHFKTANANMLWAAGIQDIRGYDSIIPKQYADYMRGIEPQGDLLYNRISPLRNRAALESPLIDLLGVRYVLAEGSIDTPGFTQVYADDGLRIYENTRAMARAYLVDATAFVVAPVFTAAIQTRDPRLFAIVDACPAGLACTGVPASTNTGVVNITAYRSNDVWIDVQKPASGQPWLILNDSYFPGWRAFVRPLGGDDASEQEVLITRVNGNFRAVPISGIAAPAVTVRFKYLPDSFRFGTLITALTLITLVFAGGVYSWRSLAVDTDALSGASRVLRNSAVLSVMNIVGRLIGFASAIVIARLIGAEGVGAYGNAVVLIGPFDIVMNFGLNTWLTRQVAQDKANASAYFSFTTQLRLLLAAAIAPLLLLLAFVGLQANYFSPEIALVLAILGLSQVISSVNSGLSALFFAFERGEIPAALSLVAAVLTSALGVTLLFAGVGLRGLAITSIIVNLVTFAVLRLQARRTLGISFAPNRHAVQSTRMGLLRDAFPLMLNHLIPAIEYKLDVPLIKAAVPPAAIFGTTLVNQNAVAGWYYTGYRYIDAFNIIPSFFTQSFFPAMARLAAKGDQSLNNALGLATKLLVMIALPLATLTTFLSPWMAGVFGPSFVPHGAVALSIVSWSMAAGWINSLTNYALIAANLQSKLTRAFVITLVFNAIGNLIFIPAFSYIGAAVVTIASEIVKGAVFYYFVHKHIGPLNWVRILAWPFLATGLMAAVSGISAYAGMLLPGLFLGGLLYVLVLWSSAAFSAAERDILRSLLRRK